MINDLRSLMTFYRLRRKMDPPLAYLLAAGAQNRGRLPPTLPPVVSKAEAWRLQDRWRRGKDDRMAHQLVEQVFGPESWPAIEEFVRRADRAGAPRR
ncbi:hypothetical protein [Egicoccus halophilus]|uniref:Uncharacterized protein n=1 Tax=Egicoccus halophilus TaxID=1670830 RepID=A0A8J3A9F8_9ACTN|nr:hypothetical protein [Egicoccus halophilus]GGI07552.1 hypothetical protein GCM10011354_24660 [Egicoccus halophilus]